MDYNTEENRDKKVRKEYGHLVLMLSISHLPYLIISSILLILGVWQDGLNAVLKVFHISTEKSFYSFTFLIIYLLFVLIGSVINRINKEKFSDLSHALLDLIMMPRIIATFNPILVTCIMTSLFLINIFNGNNISSYLLFLVIHIIFIKISCDSMLENYLEALLEVEEENKNEQKNE